MKKISPSRKLANRLSKLFSFPPVKAGMRLVPGRTFAQRLQLGDKCIRKALQLLYQDGVLAKRHGSGFYIRKIPKYINEGIDCGRDLELLDVFPLSELEKNEKPKLSPLPSQQQLHIQLWSGFHHSGSYNYSMYERIKNLVENRGHLLELRDIIDKSRVSMEINDITKELRNSPADAYLVTSPLGEKFRTAYQKVYGTEANNIVYLSLWGDEISLEPLFSQDGRDATMQVIRKFYDNGLKRIAMAGVKEAYHSQLMDEHIYDFAMNVCGLDYRMTEHFPPTEEKAFAAINSMLKSDAPPEALFVADDRLWSGVKKALLKHKIIPGEDIALVVVSNSDRNSKIFPECTCIDFNKELIGAMAINELLNSLLVAGTELRSTSLRGKWIFNNTHKLKK